MKRLLSIAAATAAIALWPAHGAGSVCGGNIADREMARVADTVREDGGAEAVRQGQPRLVARGAGRSGCRDVDGDGGR